MENILKGLNGLLKMLYFMDEELDLPKKIMIPAKEPTTYDLCGEVLKRLTKEGAAITANVYSYSVHVPTHRHLNYHLLFVLNVLQTTQG